MFQKKNIGKVIGFMFFCFTLVGILCVGGYWVYDTMFTGSITITSHDYDPVNGIVVIPNTYNFDDTEAGYESNKIPIQIFNMLPTNKTLTYNTIDDNDTGLLYKLYYTNGTYCPSTVIPAQSSMNFLLSIYSYPNVVPSNYDNIKANFSLQ